MTKPGTIIATGLKSDFKLSGSSVLPAYPGFIVMKIPQVCWTGISLSSKIVVLACFLIASKIVEICWATTESTSISILLNSSKHPQTPADAKPSNIFPKDWKSRESEQF